MSKLPKNKYPTFKCSRNDWSNIVKPYLEKLKIVHINDITEFSNNIYIMFNFGYDNNNEFKCGITYYNNIEDVVKDNGYIIHYVNSFLYIIDDIINNYQNMNILEKLINCKKGTELYSPLFGKVKFDSIDNSTIYISINNQTYSFNRYGQYFNNYNDAECLLFPSKYNRDWNKFQILEKGHKVMCSNNGYDWSLQVYLNEDMCSNSIMNIYHVFSYTYIVPVEDFDFNTEDLSINKERSIV